MWECRRHVPASLGNPGRAVGGLGTIRVEPPRVARWRTSPLHAFDRVKSEQGEQERIALNGGDGWEPGGRCRCLKALAADALLGEWGDGISSLPHGFRYNSTSEGGVRWGKAGAGEQAARHGMGVTRRPWFFSPEDPQ